MRRNIRLEDISDGKLYTAEDMVKADCRGCEGCSACCHGMGSSILLDPWDIWLLTRVRGRILPDFWQNILSWGWRTDHPSKPSDGGKRGGLYVPG